MTTISRVACVGTGLVGQGWATVFSAMGYELMLHDKDVDTLQAAEENIASNLLFIEENGLAIEGSTDSALKRIKTTNRLADAVGEADYIQESVFDSYELKRRVFREIEKAAPKSAIIASSASGLLMTKIQTGLAFPGRCVLAHPYLPVHLMPVVEVVGGKLTSSETVETTSFFMQRVGKTPIVLNREVPGYIVNRLQAALLREAIDLVNRGVASAEDVDRAFRLSAGLRSPFMGPLLRAHLAGDGIERFFKNYAQSYRNRWKSLAKWSSISRRAARAAVNGVYKMEMVRCKSLADIKQWRDAMVVKLLKIVRENENS